MRLSYFIISFNRCDTLRHTLSLLPDRTSLANGEWDIWVIDNASSDGTDKMMAAEFPQVNYHRLPANIGMPARNYAFDRAAGEYIICLDDDSYPADNEAIERMISYMDITPDVGALVARVELPDGTPEAPAFPSVLLGGATCFRASVLKQVGGFSREFFRQAEEYELIFRICGSGFMGDRFEDIVFRHDKVSGPGRASDLVHRMDVRNNIIVAERFLPRPLRRAYREDWSQRYTAIAEHADHARAASQGRRQAKWCGIKEMIRGRQVLSDTAIERIFQFQRQTDQVIAWSEWNGIRSVCVADFSKNIFATMNACARAGLKIVSIIDDNPAFWGMSYRGINIVPSNTVPPESIDGIVMSNINPAQIDKRMDALRGKFAGPILRLWQGKKIRSVTSHATIAA
ncbi:hypothetical protein BH10PLA1_BH10PLA1_00610 [soil metagenome]